MAKLFMSTYTNTRKRNVTACGSSLICTSVSGWDVGVLVEATVEEDGSVRIDVWKTGGSNVPIAGRHLAMVTDKEKLRTDL